MTILLFRHIETIRFLIQITFKIYILYVDILKMYICEYFKIRIMFYSESYVGKFFNYNRQSVS